jgi:hypothetical protein
VAAPAYVTTAAGGGGGSSAGGSGGRILDTPDGADDAADSGSGPSRVAPRPVPTRRPGGAAAPRPRQKRRRR